MEAISRLRVFLKRYGATLLATGSSQVVMGVNTLLFWVLGPNGADLYTVGIQVGNLSFTGFVFGVVYLVVVGRPNFKHWKLAELAAIGLSLFASLAGVAVVMSGNTKHETVDLVAILFFGIGGAALAFQGIKYVREACQGNPTKLAAATMAPNFGLLLGLLAVLIFRLAGDWSVILPSMLWMLGTFLLLFDRKPIAAIRSHSEIIDQSKGLLSHFGILLLGLITSSFMPFIYLHTLSGLPAGSIAFAFLLIRITSSSMYLVSNSILLVRFNWIQNKISLGKSEARVLVSITALLSVCLATALLHQKAISLTSAILALAFSLFTSSMLLRELNFAKKNKPLLLKVCLDLALSCCASYALFLNPSVLGLFAVYLISQSITIMISSWSLGLRKISVLSFFCLVLCLGMLGIR
jgi:hypothetical protein